MHKLGDNDYCLDVNGKLKTFHANLLKRYIDRVDMSKVASNGVSSGSDVNAAEMLEVIAQATIVDQEDDDDEEDGSPTPSPMTVQVPVLFRFRIEAIRGSDNVGADFLSRS